MFNEIPSPSVIWDESCRIAFHIGSLPIYWYGVFIFFGFVTAIVLSIIKLVCWYKVKCDPFYYFCLMGIPIAILGARFWSCCIGDGDWSNFFNLSAGGLAIQGGVVATVLLACIWFPLILKRPSFRVRDELAIHKPAIRQVSMWVYFDAVVPCILIAQFLGRWGNYFNQEVYGGYIKSESYMEFLSNILPYMYVNGEWHHPLFLYEGLGNLCAFFLLYVGLEFIPKIKAGTIGMCYFLWYSIIRFIMEPFRVEDYTFLTTYMMNGLWFVCSLIFIILNQVNIVPKTRKYYCFSFIWENLFAFPLKNSGYQIKLKQLNNKIKKLQSRSPKQKERIKDYDKSLKALHDKYKYYSSEYIAYSKQHENKIRLCKKNQNEIFYYLGR